MKSQKTKASLEHHHVRFHDDMSKLTIIHSKPLSEAEINNSWYSKIEIERFKILARIISRKFALTDYQRRLDEACISGSRKVSELYRRYRKNLEKEVNMDTLTTINKITKNEILNIEEDYELRGLEERISFERQKNKCLVLQSVLDFQNKVRAKQKRREEEVLMTKKNHEEKVMVSVYANVDLVSLKIAEFSSKMTVWARQNALVTGRADYVIASCSTSTTAHLKKASVTNTTPREDVFSMSRLLPTAVLSSKRRKGISEEKIPLVAPAASVSSCCFYNSNREESSDSGGHKNKRQKILERSINPKKKKEVEIEWRN